MELKRSEVKRYATLVGHHSAEPKSIMTVMIFAQEVFLKKLR